MLYYLHNKIPRFLLPVWSASLYCCVLGKRLEIPLLASIKLVQYHWNDRHKRQRSSTAQDSQQALRIFEVIDTMVDGLWRFDGIRYSLDTTQPLISDLGPGRQQFQFIVARNFLYKQLLAKKSVHRLPDL